MASTQLYAPVVNGEIQDTSAAANSLSSTYKKSNSSLDKDAFLNILVAEMKYQDPLEPTSNTEYISQFATFSQLEELQNMESVTKQDMANNLVGKDVILKVTSEKTGGVSYVSGPVDYVLIEDGKVYLSVGDGTYSIDDLDTIIDSDYLEASNLQTTMKALIAKIPTKNNITLTDEATIVAARKLYDSMTDYQKSFISDDMVTTLKQAEAKIAELKLAAGGGSSDDDKTDSSDDDKTDSDKTDTDKDDTTNKA